MADKITIVLGQKDHRDFDLGETRTVVLPPETEQVEVVPTTSEQIIVPSHKKYINKINVKPVTADIDANITENNIRQGVTILGKTGNLAPDKPDQSKTTIPTKERQVVKADLGYELAENIVEPIPDEYEIPVLYDGVLQVTPTKESQDLEVVNKKMPSNITINPIPDEFVVTSDADATVNDIKLGKTAYVNGEKITGEYEPIDLSETTATAEDVLAGKIFFDAEGVKTEGIYGLPKNARLIIPEELSSVDSIFTYSINKDKMLVGSSGNGIWLYNIKEDNWKKIYGLYTHWGVFQQIDESRHLISTTMWDYGILIYDDTTETITQISSNGMANIFFQFNENIWLLNANNSNGSGVRVYDNSTMTCTKLYSNGNATSLLFFKVNENKAIIYSTSNFSNILVYDNITQTVTLKYSEFKNIYYFAIIGNNCLITASSSTNGILLFDDETNSISLIYEQGLYRYFMVVGNLCLIASNNSNYAGILKYDNDLKTIEKIYSSGYNYSYAYRIKDVVLIASNSSSASGVYMYDMEINSVTKIYDQKYNWQYFYQLDENRLLIHGSYNSAGLLLFDYTEKTITALSTTGYEWKMKDIGTNKILFSYLTNGSGIYVFNKEDNSFTRITTSGSKWEYYQQVTDNLWLIGSSDLTRDNGLILYNENDDTAKRTYYYGSGYDTFIQENGYWVVEPSAKIDKALRILKFVPETQTATMIGIYAEV